MKITAKKAAAYLRKANDILILSHQNPDGDTLGAALALFYGLRQLGKRVRIECADGIPERFRLEALPEFEAFEPQCIVAVDIAALRRIRAMPDGFCCMSVQLRPARSCMSFFC